MKTPMVRPGAQPTPVSQAPQSRGPGDPSSAAGPTTVTGGAAEAEQGHSLLPASGAVTPEMVAQFLTGPASAELKERIEALIGDLDSDAPVAESGDVDVSVKDQALFDVEKDFAKILRHFQTNISRWNNEEKNGPLITLESMFVALEAEADGMLGDDLSSEQQATLKLLSEAVAKVLVQNKQQTSLRFDSKVQARLEELFRSGLPMDTNRLVVWVQRASYLATTLDLRYYAEKVRHFNAQKKALRGHLTFLRNLRREFAVTEEEATQTALNGNDAENGGTGGASGANLFVPPTTQQGAPPPYIIRSETDRVQFYPQENIALQPFLSRLANPQEFRSYVNDPVNREAFMNLVQYLSPEELLNVREVYGNQGNGWMWNFNQTRDFVTDIIANATPQQILSIEAQRQAGDPRAADFRQPASNAYDDAVAAATATLEAELGVTGIPAGELVLQAEQAYLAEIAAQQQALLEQQQQQQTQQQQGEQPPPEPTEVVNFATLWGDLDKDPSDGDIDGVSLASGPPYLRASGQKVKTVSQLDGEIETLEEWLNTVGDDAQLANVDLQNILQKQQQTIQLMSNVLKMLHDTVMAIVRKIGA